MLILFLSQVFQILSTFIITMVSVHSNILANQHDHINFSFFPFLLIAVPHGQHFTQEFHETHYGVPFTQHHVLSAPVYSSAYVAQPGKL